MGEGPRAVEGRVGFLFQHLRESLGPQALGDSRASLTLGRGVVWVKGGEELVKKARDAVARLRSTRDRIVAVRVRAAAVTAPEETRLLRGLAPGGTVVAGEGVRLFRLEGEERSRVGYSVSGAAGRIEHLSEVISARSTQLVHVTAIRRRSFLREFRTGPDGERWPAYDSVDEGLVVEARPVALPEGGVTLSLSARVARVLDRGAKEADASPRAPVHAVSAGTVRANLDQGHALLLSGLPAPTPVEDRRDRLLLFITVEPAAPK
jgi:hypothetical protein